MSITIGLQGIHLDDLWVWIWNVGLYFLTLIAMYTSFIFLKLLAKLIIWLKGSVQEETDEVMVLAFSKWYPRWWSFYQNWSIHFP